MPAPKRLALGLTGLAFSALCLAASAAAGGLPPSVQEALRRARLPEEAFGSGGARGGQRPQPPGLERAQAGESGLSVQAAHHLCRPRPARPRLGLAHTGLPRRRPRARELWKGLVWVRGSGDPKLVVERVWLLLRQLQERGVREIRGDILLDSSAWAPPAVSPAEFDGEPSRPYNVQPDALLLNFKTVTLTFTPDASGKRALISAEPRLAGVAVDASVALAAGACADWRQRLQADWSDPQRMHFAGVYPSACGEQNWPVAYAQPERYNARLVEQLWREMGGKLGGQVKEGAVPSGLRPSFELSSPTLAEVVRDINKFSNNVMAEQLYYTLAAANRAPGAAVKPEGAKDVLEHWLRSRLGEAGAAEVVVAGGSGLSRDSRVSASALATLLQQAWRSPVMPELISSLPVSGLDGTLRRSAATPGFAHLKTGSLRDTAAIAGYVLASNGKRYVVVAILNDPQAGAGRPALDALTQWVIDGARSSERVVERP